MPDQPDWMSDQQRDAMAVLQDMCAATDMDLVPVARGEHGSYLEVDLEGSDAEATFGTHGKSLDALQYLANLIVARRVGMDVRVILDAAGYRERRAQVLTDLAVECANQVKERQEECELDALPPHERRIVHTALKDDTAIVTYSEGEEPDRRVIIAPREASPSA
jgi:spoIIIJ-associated protein